MTTVSATEMVVPFSSVSCQVTIVVMSSMMSTLWVMTSRIPQSSPSISREIIRMIGLSVTDSTGSQSALAVKTQKPV
ncbi:hypothetical protein FDA94_29170 [Herbidospora galbida]|uniref:Uncharacterized protein n=1 Tax=Herbidospora galbida TaxID=2575442 RepID=A0A4U3MAI3_9ACTN|nr:hypothetical protein FDA94_29170 [Herbidospora galbida]